MDLFRTGLLNINKVQFECRYLLIDIKAFTTMRYFRNFILFLLFQHNNLTKSSFVQIDPGGIS